MTKCHIARLARKKVREKMAKLFAPYDPITEIFLGTNANITN